MKSTLTKVFSLSMIVCLLFSCQIVFADTKIKEKAQEQSGTVTQSATAEDLPLYERLGYQEDFVYEDEMIGHALKSTVVYVTQECNFSITYQPLELDTTSLTTLIDNNPDVSSDTITAHVLEHHRDYFQYGSDTTVDQQCISQGSGVFLGDNGYVATNAHVVEPPTDDVLSAYAYEVIQEYWEADLDAIVDDMADNGLTITVEDLDFIENDNLHYQYYSRDISCEITSTNMIISTPTSDGKTNLISSNDYQAKVVKCGVSSGENAEGLTRDIAILKIDETNLVGLSLSDTYPEVNSNIVSGGFPAVANEIFEAIGYESTLSATIGTGKVARLVPIKGTDYKAMEITTNISSGSSGGPSVDNHLQIEGLNTYSNSSDIRFAYMVPAEAIIDMAENLEIEQADISKTYLTGLQMLQQGYGKAAKDCFTEIQLKRRSIPYLDNLIKLAEDAPQTSPIEEEEVTSKAPVEENLPKNAKPQEEIPVFFIIAGASAVVLIIFAVAFIVIKKNKRKKSTPAEVTVSNQEESYQKPHVEPEINRIPTKSSKIINTISDATQPVEPRPTLKASDAPTQDVEAESYFSPGADLDL